MAKQQLWATVFDNGNCPRWLQCVSWSIWDRQDKCQHDVKQARPILETIVIWPWSSPKLPWKIRPSIANVYTWTLPLPPLPLAHRWISIDYRWRSRHYTRMSFHVNLINLKGTSQELFPLLEKKHAAEQGMWVWAFSQPSLPVSKIHNVYEHVVKLMNFFWFTACLEYLRLCNECLLVPSFVSWFVSYLCLINWYSYG